MEKGDIVTVVTISGEYVGVLESFEDATVVLNKPRMVVQTEKGMGFAHGVAVTIDSTHQCMTMRGIKKEQATTVTNFYLGQFKDDLSYQNRYLRFIAK